MSTRFSIGVRYVTAVLVSVCLFTSSRAHAQMREEQTVQQAQAVLNETMANAATRIPASMLNGAHAVAVIPGVIKGSFVVGARHGRGVLCVRDAAGPWHAPVFITLTGGNVGWQIGVNSSDIVLVFKTAQSVQGILDGKLTLGADVAAAAGPLGGQASAGTDGRLQAEIYSYARTRGLFAGVAIDGSVIKIDQLATGAYYRSAGPGQPVIVPPTAQQLTQSIAAVTGTNTPPVAPAGAIPTGPVPGQPAAGQPAAGPGFVDQFATHESDVLRDELTKIAPELFDLVDPQWQAFLALPKEMFAASAHVTPEDLAPTLARYQTVATNPQYRALAQRPEFQSVYGLLQHYHRSLQPDDPKVQLPPPPAMH
ncbi:lipid-binding SYLF domain-containing protein [Crateriforma conspicua]|uniref:Ysc84 actin-binding domain-containing protein n=1 Tax=Crateriforma conspicua TaxID=2527996 RepID=A0A5C6FU46_9PLAN|nr:lipid-binding SYLF domain-containing protein [Crateriforma conspicua]TWU64733.1 hypothetical protein V7x_02770 [Crateriforma conspicua]